MAQPPLEENLEDPVVNQTFRITPAEQIDGGDSIIYHSNIPLEPDKGEDGRSKADLERYVITNICELAIEERNEGVGTSNDPTTSSSAKESPSLLQDTFHRPHDGTRKKLEIHDEVRDNLMICLDRPSMKSRSIRSFDGSCSRTLSMDSTHDWGSGQHYPFGRGQGTLIMPDGSDSARSNQPHDPSEGGPNEVIEEQWRRAIEQKDCKTLLELCNQRTDLSNRRTFMDGTEFMLSVQWGSRTSALHIAAMQGCVPLAKFLLYWMAMSPVHKDCIDAIEPRSGLTAYEMANDVTGNRSISKCIRNEPYFHVASPSSPWYLGMRFYNPEGLLLMNSRLLLETFHGVSVLHLAILRNNVQLVKVIMSVFGPEKKIKWGESYYPTELSWEQMSEINPKNIDFDKIDSDFLEDVSVNFRSLVSTQGTALHWATQLDRSLGIIALIKQYEDSPEQVAPSTLGALPELNSAVITFLDKKWNVDPEWEKGFMEDVDFNFEAEPRLSLLRFHHACKDPLKFKDFLQSAFLEIEDFGKFSVMMHDGQGRTMYHTLMDHHTDDLPPGWALQSKTFSISETDLQFAVNAKGNCVSSLLLTKNYLQRNILMQPSSYWSLIFQGYPSEGHTSGHSKIFMFYHVACILKQTILAQHILSEILKREGDNFKKSLNCNFKSWLRIALSTGNYTLLSLLLGLPSCDPTIAIDEEGRTALHYAADGTLLDHLELIFGFPIIWNMFSSVKEVGDFKTKWKEERSNSLVTFPSKGEDSNSMEAEVQFNVERKACILMLLQAGCDLSQADNDSKVPKVGPTRDANFQSWWYDTVVKDTTDQKNGFNQAGNALSVVGTLVAATSYIGPLQPPMSYTDGFVNVAEKLVEVFMATNTMAFYFAMASVMFAVVPSLPMPRESVMSELKRARHMVSLSLCFLLVATVMIIISFAAATLAVIQQNQYGLRFGPTVIGWFVCMIAIASFVIRVMRLMFFENPVVKRIYQFSFTAESKKFGASIKRGFIEKFGASIERGSIKIWSLVWMACRRR